MGIVETLPPVDAAGARPARTVPDGVAGFQPHTAETESEIGAQGIGDVMQEQSGYLRWPAALQTQYRRDVGHRIERDQYFLLVLGFMVAMATMVIDALVSVAIFRDGAVLRLATVVPITVLGLVAANRGWSRIVTLCLGASPVAFVGVVAHLAMHMPIQHAALYLNATALVIGIGNITLPFTLRGLLLFNLAAVAAVTASIAQFGPGSLWLHTGCLVVLTVVAAATLIISHRFERLRQHNFLLNLHARATSHELLEANGQLEDLSNRDPLTGLPNRRFFNRMFDDTVAEMRSDPGGEQPRDCQIALLMIDLDHFKAFNDTHGHIAGDEALRIVGHELSSILQNVDGIAARYGGEEFVAAFCAQTVKEAELIAEDIRSTIASLLVPIWPTGRSIITTSVGIAVAAAGESPKREELIAAADDALYIAKRSGRNRVESITLSAEPLEAAE